MSQLWGQDPLGRTLRTLSLLCFLGVFIVVIVDPVRRPDTPTIALLIGGILVQLGYDVGVRLLGLLDRRKSDSDG